MSSSVCVLVSPAAGGGGGGGGRGALAATGGAGVDSRDFRGEEGLGRSLYLYDTETCSRVK